MIDSEPNALGHLITGMRASYASGGNAMAFARKATQSVQNSTTATLIAYDLQAGSYVAAAKSNPALNKRWCAQLAEILDPFCASNGSLLEVGCGEATTLAGVLQHLSHPPGSAMGFDVSWSRCAVGRQWLEAQGVAAHLFVADLFHIPLADRSVDVVYTSHSLEPNGGQEEAALAELLRVARRVVVLVEPLYELAGTEAQARMRTHGYVRGLHAAAERLGAPASVYGLLPYSPNPLNPSGLIVIEKNDTAGSASAREHYRCPLTHLPLGDAGDVYVSPAAGVAYPVMRGIPLLRREHAVVASKLLPSVT